jgi:hypothetical protein
VPRASLVAAAVGHRLAAAGLVERVVDLAAEALEQLERGDADLREEGVDVAGNEQGHFHARTPRFEPGRQFRDRREENACNVPAAATQPLSQIKRPAPGLSWKTLSARLSSILCSQAPLVDPAGRRRAATSSPRSCRAAAAAR